MRNFSEGMRLLGGSSVRIMRVYNTKDIKNNRDADRTKGFWNNYWLIDRFVYCFANIFNSTRESGSVDRKVVSRKVCIKQFRRILAGCLRDYIDRNRLSRGGGRHQVKVTKGEWKASVWVSEIDRLGGFFFFWYFHRKRAANAFFVMRREE